MGAILKDYSTIVLRRLRGNIKDSAEKIAEIGVEAVQEKMLWGYNDPHGDDGHTEIVDTGRLFDSITGSVNRISDNMYQAVVSTDVPYAGYVHDGTSKLKGRPYLVDGMKEATPKIKEAIKAAIRDLNNP